MPKVLLYSFAKIYYDEQTEESMDVNVDLTYLMELICSPVSRISVFFLYCRSVGIFSLKTIFQRFKKKISLYIF